jgi:hypothetical protein
VTRFLRQVFWMDVIATILDAAYKLVMALFLAFTLAMIFDLWGM